jgi:hypothetical protein
MVSAFERKVKNTVNCRKHSMKMKGLMVLLNYLVASVSPNGPANFIPSACGALQNVTAESDDIFPVQK